MQFDAVQTDGHVDVTAAGARDTTTRAYGISVFFRQAGSPTEVGIYSSTVGERDTDNYAVRFRIAAGVTRARRRTAKAATTGSRQRTTAARPCSHSAAGGFR